MMTAQSVGSLRMTPLSDILFVRTKPVSQLGQHHPVLSVENLHTSFITDSGEVKAVNGVSFNLDAGKILGVVGESGSGKSVTAYSILQILDQNGRIVEGDIKFKGKSLLEYSQKELDAFRGNN